MKESHSLMFWGCFIKKWQMIKATGLKGIIPICTSIRPIVFSSLHLSFFYTKSSQLLVAATCKSGKPGENMVRRGVNTEEKVICIPLNLCVLQRRLGCLC